MNITAPQIVFGYHGCISHVAEKVFSGEIADLSKTKETETYHWLGRGIYFWENAADRAAEWAIQHANRNFGKASDREKRQLSEQDCEPTVVGAVIRLGNCLNLLDVSGHGIIRAASEDIKHDLERCHAKIENRNWIHTLDCLSINKACSEAKPEFDTVRGCFPEGSMIFDGSFIQDKTHVQISVRNEACIIGYFRPKNVAELISNARIRLNADKKQQANAPSAVTARAIATHAVTIYINERGIPPQT